MTRRGFFIVLEGPEGSGKSTLIGPLAERMRAAGTDPVVIREPGGTRAAEIARQALLDPEHPVGPVAELFLYLDVVGVEAVAGDADPAGSPASPVAAPKTAVTTSWSDGTAPNVAEQSEGG